ncbi:hypothetical protein TorRG33x02_112920, partial [Trema orientale]
IKILSNQTRLKSALHFSLCPLCEIIYPSFLQPELLKSEGFLASQRRVFQTGQCLKSLLHDGNCDNTYTPAYNILHYKCF